ncbi:MAG: YjiH family protein [Cellulosilyticum sp.]|nr:YjiH family protein [Cellulosilyticum sp.]
MKNSLTTSNKPKLGPILKFLLPSLLGIFLFMLPIPYGDSLTIPIAILSSSLQSLLANYMLYILFIVVALSAIGSIITKLCKPKFILGNQFLTLLFNPSGIWFILRLIAFFFISIIFLVHKGWMPSTLLSFAEIINSSDTGGLVVGDLLPILFSIFLFAGVFLPLLLNFGLLEFIGCLLANVMRPIFGLPGRAAIDCIASWLGDGTIGVLLTSRQYEEGFYTEREAVVIGTTFSLVSITFSLVVINNVGLGHLFVPFYLTVTVASLIAAVIMPKLPPLSLKKDVLYDGSLPNLNESNNLKKSSFKVGFDTAIAKAESQDFIKCTVIDGIKNVLDMWIGVIPVVLAVGTIALILATYTPLFEILGIPFIPFLNLLGIPEAGAAAQTLVAGFADMILPSILASSIESEMTRFIIACVSVTQLIYLSEVGSLLLGSKIPVKLWELFIIFIERTLITLPIIALIAHIIF